MDDRNRPASASEVRNILGPVDDEVILRVLETGASPPEVVEALNWRHADDQLGQTLLRQPSGRVAAVCDILSADDDEEDPGF